MPKVKSAEEFFDGLAKDTQAANTPPQEPNEPVTPPVEPPVETPVEPVDPPVEPPVEPNEPNEPNEPPVPVEPDQPVVPEPEGVIDKWDEPVEPVVTTEPPTVNLYEDLGKDLGVEGLTKEQLQEALKPKEEAVITGIPDDVALLVNLAKSGVDYKEYLNLKNTDYNSFNDKTLVEHSVRDALKDNEGNISPENQEKLEDYLEGLSEMDITIQGNQIRNSLVNARDARIGQIESSVANVNQQKDVELNASLEKFNEVSGFKVQPHQKQSLQKQISSGEAVANLMYKPDGSYDYDKIVKLTFIAENFDKMLSYHKQRAKTDEKRANIDRAANVNTGQQGSLPAPDAPVPVDGMDLFLKQYGYKPEG
jgi:hypothetical protein